MKGGKESSDCRIRAPGQRSLLSTRLFDTVTAAGRFKEKRLGQRIPEEEGKKTNNDKKTKPLQLSDFLNRKLHSTSSVLPINQPNQGKQSNFNISTNQTDNRSSRCNVIDSSVFKQFSHASTKLDNADISKPKGDYDDVRRCVADNDVEQRTRKTTNPFIELEVGCNKDPRSSIIVLGDDPKPKRSALQAFSNRTKKPRAIYNHYENGHGWWDYERESVDNDEVGSTNVWEGIGSITVGGLQWH